ncbi:MAG TPA: SIMPL domain-containing protein [Candidatus Acidoferrum sp.]|nr:SIMPL domain-containing protein [Candidatus Acidoferrum sp.]
MKARLILMLAAALLPLPPALAQSPPPQINVSGSAEVKVAPDEIHLSVGVETRDAALDVARQQNDERVAGALAFLKRGGVKDQDVQTDYISVEPDYDFNKSRVQPVAYIVRKSIEIKLAAATNLEGTLTGLLTNGINYVHGIDFRTSQLRKFRDQAREMAIKAAREKADAMASALGVKRGKIYSINVNDWGGGWSGFGGSWGQRWNYGYQGQNAVQYRADSGGMADISGETFSVGQISVSATVNVSFLIE